jgi:hypothetical protein
MPGISYSFSTTTTDSDPGAGFLRLDNATQNTATTIRADLLDRFGTDWTAALDTFDDSTSTVRGFIRLISETTPTRWLLFTVSALAAPSGYRNITVACIASSAASPFSDGEVIRLQFDRTGDAGQQGLDGLDGARGPAPAGVLTLTASGMVPATTNGAAQNKNVAATNVQNYYSLDFDTTTQEFAHAVLAMPSDWDGSTITAQFWWTATGTSTNSVVWALEGRSYGDSETIDQAYGTPQQIADAHTATALQAQLSGATPAITLGGTPASGELVMFRVKRVPADGSDTLAVDAMLLAVVINYSRKNV